MELKDEIKKIASQILDEIIVKRRYLHQNPELSFFEYETSAYIKKTLDELDIPWLSIADTGVIADIVGKKNKKSNKTVVLRADMDALPIEENTSFSFKSKNSGVMHACGHDFHISSLLGVAHILKRLENEFCGNIKLLFQPAEEILPGGAIKILEEGVLQSCDVDIVVGQHVMPSILSGKIALRKGKFMSSMDEIRIKIIGKGGHGAEPHNVKDPVAVAATVIVSLQQVISRFSNPNTPSVLSFGKIEANGSTNIIPDDVNIEGTFRTMDEKWRAEAHELIKNITKSITEGFNCECEVDIKKGYPLLYNNPDLTADIRDYAIQLLGQDKVIDADIWMASEDFAYYSQNFTSCFYLLGTGFKDKNNIFSLHTSTLELDEDALETGMSLMSFIAIKHLEG